MNLSAPRFNKKSVSGFLILFVLYIFWVIFFIGFRSDHILFILVIVTFYFSSEWTHKLSLALIFFIAFWILYDSMRVIPNYEVNIINIKEPYDIEKYLFGVLGSNYIITPNEYFIKHNNVYFDFLAGFFYLLWIPAPLAYAVYLYFKDKKLLIQFSAAFLFTNIIGFIIYYLYPAAPPWYVDIHGFEIDHSIPGNPAALIRFDHIIGIPLFQNMYTKNANVFAAVPSLHAAYPVILFYYGLKKNLKVASFLFFIIMIGIWFAAVYSIHHYIIDVILGIFCAIFALVLFEKLILKSRINTQIDRFVNYIR